MKAVFRSAPAMALAALTFGLSAPAAAGPYADALSMCLVKSTTSQDKATLVQWMFATMALHPDVKKMSAVASADRSQLNKNFAGLVQSLLTQSCVAEAKAAVKYEGPSTFESSFTVLGQVASRELFSHPAVTAGMAGMGKDIDNKKLGSALGL